MELMWVRGAKAIDGMEGAPPKGVTVPAVQE